MVDSDTEERSVGGRPFCNKILGLTNGELDFHLGGLSNPETPLIHAQDGVATANARIDQLLLW
ncbi:hypothetical protein PJI16_18735 [Nitrospira sp. MA-1]|nr:hypothetical protein [Nitrospira sp. MA-1]